MNTGGNPNLLHAARKLEARNERGRCGDCIHCAMLAQLDNPALCCRLSPPVTHAFPDMGGKVIFKSLYPLLWIAR